MRGSVTFTERLSSMHRLDDCVPADHPLRPIRLMVNQALEKMDSLFTQMYEADIKGGRTAGLAVIPDSIRDPCLMNKQAGRSGMDCGC